MRARVDVRFLNEMSEFALRFTCGDCLHFLADEGRCAHEWPNHDHRAPPGAGEPEVVFCKEFEVR
jgi:hypothetical protein